MPYLFIDGENLGYVLEKPIYNSNGQLVQTVLDVKYDDVRWPAFFEQVYTSNISWEIRESSSDSGRTISGVLSKIGDNPGDRSCRLVVEINTILIG